ncbi:MAG: AraC family transcriptional regulator [Actinobacteria bacterium]|nr:AraC family transcriptional regulator [Actinomycetota bacterium]
MTVALVQTPAAAAFIGLTESIPQVMAALKDIDGRYVYVNAGFCRRLGLTAREILGSAVHELFAADMADSYAQQDAAVISRGTPMQGHLELIVRADGALGWYVTSKAPVPDASGDWGGVAVLSIDLNSQVNSAHAGLAEVISAVRSDISAPWRLAELADLAGLSVTQLQRLCRSTLGISPQQVIQRLRLEHAVHLATTTTLPFGAIAAECGFYDQASFTRQFRRVLGLTPGAYRSRRRAG